MKLSESVVLRPDVVLERTGEGGYRLASRSGALCHHVGPATDPSTLEALATAGMPFDDDGPITHLWRQGWLSLVVNRDGRPT
ncbi:hypothetical protein AB0K48_19195, partial [Nonomuraea sp. NPDC055795]